MVSKAPFVDPEKNAMVLAYLESKKVPISVRKIWQHTKLNKRQILAICHQNESISHVHPEYYGSGRFNGSVFVASTDKKKYSHVKRYVDL